MTRRTLFGRTRGRSDGRRLGPMALLMSGILILPTGCGGPSPPPAQEGRSAFSYDDDEIDPATLKPQKGQTKTKARR